MTVHIQLGITVLLLIGACVPYLKVRRMIRNNDLMQILGRYLTVQQYRRRAESILIKFLVALVFATVCLWVGWFILGAGFIIIGFIEAFIAANLLHHLEQYMTHHSSEFKA